MRRSNRASKRDQAPLAGIQAAPPTKKPRILYGQPQHEAGSGISECDEGDIDDGSSFYDGGDYGMDDVLPSIENYDNTIHAGDLNDPAAVPLVNLVDELHALHTAQSRLDLDSTPTLNEDGSADFIERFETEDTAPMSESATECAPSEDTLRMPPPSIRSTSTLEQPEGSEEIPHVRSIYDMDDFNIAFALWVEDAGLSRPKYRALLEIFDLLEDIQPLRLLPRSLTSLKYRIKSKMPLIKMRRKEIPLVPEKLPTMSPNSKNMLSLRPPMGWLYWFDPVDLFKVILSSPQFRAKMHIGMADFVDHPSEFYHSASWGSSIRSCSGDFSYYSDGQPIFPSDMVRWKCLNPGTCECHVTDEKLHFGRVINVGRDRTSWGLFPNAITLQVQLYLQPSNLPTQYEAALETLPLALRNEELLCIEDRFEYLLEEHIVRREAAITFDYSGADNPLREDQDYLVRHIVNFGKCTARSLKKSDPHRGELEIATFGRKTLTDNHKPGHCISLPLILFMDAFGLYRNMYRTLMGVYLNFAALNRRERSRRYNVFPITLGPHGSSLKDVIAALQVLKAFDRGVELEIDGELKLVCAYTLVVTGDMPQQQANAGFKSQKANLGCRSCLIPEQERGNLEFDIISSGRYHYSTMALRRQLLSQPSIAKRDAFASKWGLALEQSPLVEIAPSLDIIQTRPADPAHSEYAGLSKQAHSLLVETILNPQGQKAYNSVLRSFPFPPGWARLQSPLHHLNSMRMQEHARASIVIPVLLRCHLQESWIQKKCLEAIPHVFMGKHVQKPINNIIQCFADMARSNSVLLSESMTVQQRGTMMLLIKKGRKSFQQLHQIAIISSSSRYRSTSLTRSPSPAQGQPRQMSEGVQNWDMISQSEFAMGSPEVPTSKQGKDFINAQRRPNVHIGLHYKSVSQEFATPWNCNVMMGEDKHRFFKKIVTLTNHREVERALLLRENLQQTMRYLLMDSYQHTEVELTRALHRLHQRCPTFLQSILPNAEVGDDDNDSIFFIEGTEHQQNLAAISCIAPRYAAQTLGLPVRHAALPNLDPFNVQLRQAYSRDYQKPYIVDLGRLPLQWCKKFSFTDRISESRITFRTGDFVQLKLAGASEVAELGFLFIHEIVPGTRRLFAKVKSVEPSTRCFEDDVLGLPLLQYHLQDVEKIVGIPAVTASKLYILPLPHSQRMAQAGHSGELLYCNWNIEYM